MGTSEPKGLKPQSGANDLSSGPAEGIRPIRAGIGTSQLAPPWSRSQVNWVGKGCFVLRLATEGVSRWLLGASFDSSLVFPHERTFRKLATTKSEVIRSIRMNPWPVHLAGRFDPVAWAAALADLVKGCTPLVDTGYVSLWSVPSVSRSVQQSVGRLIALDGHHSRRAQLLLSSPLPGHAPTPNPGIFGWLESLDSPELKVRAIHRSGSIGAWVDEWIRSGELKVLSRPPDDKGGVPSEALLRCFEVVRPDKRFWCEVAAPQRVGAFEETALDALSRLARQKRVFFQTSTNFDEVLGWLERMEIDAGLRLFPPGKDLVWSRALSGQLFPQKATSFYPKLPFGLLVQDLK